jgi:hypothetical protein
VTPDVAGWTPPLLPAAAPRVSITDAMRQQIAVELQSIPPYKKAVVLVFATETETRATFAARYGDHLKAAAGVGWVYGEKRPAV